MDKYLFNVNNKDTRAATTDIALVFLLTAFNRYLPAML